MAVQITPTDPGGNETMPDHSWMVRVKAKQCSPHTDMYRPVLIDVQQFGCPEREHTHKVNISHATPAYRTRTVALKL